MKDKRLDALLETIHSFKSNLNSCAYYKLYGYEHFTCYHPDREENPCDTDCQGDIRKCEREE